LTPHWTLLETAMTPEANGSEPDPPHIEFDPDVKWPEINQVNAAAPGYLVND